MNLYMRYASTFQHTILQRRNYARVNKGENSYVCYKIISSRQNIRFRSSYLCLKVWANASSSNVLHPCFSCRKTIYYIYKRTCGIIKAKNIRFASKCMYERVSIIEKKKKKKVVASMSYRMIISAFFKHCEFRVGLINQK